ncbi:hypothetical protein [Acidisphaera rubrifaciens]|uniref:HTH cro/C1-type domain-containing protein n=1 Tax=Acidisphaera rubrifaciens HS-AP3 TaxID=1231350 RepID=A0A0D6P8Q6_9PROT|nr:hypothetical protein [Acidisphaera rubrifaciens]GAN77721.1 hypothetical protein Asru_0428_07 [Acidisphaera rubrifaciens HS-AP3]
MTTQNQSVYKNSNKPLKNRIHSFRLHFSISQQTFGSIIGVSAGAVAHYEGGATPNPTNKQAIEKLLASSEARIKELINEHDPYYSEENEDGESENDGNADDGNADEGNADDEAGDDDFASWLTSSRLKKGLSIPELASLAGVAIPTIYNIENRTSLNPQTRTREKIATALQVKVPRPVLDELDEQESVVGLGKLQDFPPHVEAEWPSCPGVYVLYDVSQRPIYVGKSSNSIAARLKSHADRFWFKKPIVEYGAYIEVNDRDLCLKLEQVLIKFLKSNAVINKQSVETAKDT